MVDENWHFTIRSWFLINSKPLNIKIKLKIIRTVYVYTFHSYFQYIIIIGVNYFFKVMVRVRFRVYRCYSVSFICDHVNPYQLQAVKWQFPTIFHVLPWSSTRPEKNTCNDWNDILRNCHTLEMAEMLVQMCANIPGKYANIAPQQVT